MCRLILGIGVAIVAWFWMFSPWTVGLTSFWATMAVASAVLLFFSCQGSKVECQRSNVEGRMSKVKGRMSKKETLDLRPQLVLGIVIAALLWGIFWTGDRVSSWIFDFARPQVDAVYSIKEGMAPWLVAVQLLLLTGPAEELFWRGYVQRNLSTYWNNDIGFIVTTALYTLIHIWSFNFMLVMAALVCGLIWGGLYRLRPQWLPALVISHALWDACIFVLFPIG